jgi:hypothetical protein
MTTYKGVAVKLQHSSPWHEMEESDQLHALIALPRENSNWYTLYRRLGGHQGQSEGCGEEKNRLPYTGNVMSRYSARCILKQKYLNISFRPSFLSKYFK